MIETRPGFVDSVLEGERAYAPKRASERETELQEALRLILDQIDYTRGACKPNESVGGVVCADVLARARKAAGLP